MPYEQQQEQEQEQEDIECNNSLIYPVDQLMTQGLCSINQSIIEHMKGNINDEVISLLEKEEYQEAFNLLQKLDLSKVFDDKYRDWYIDNAEDVIMTICDTDSYRLGY